MAYDECFVHKQSRVLSVWRSRFLSFPSCSPSCDLCPVTCRSPLVFLHSENTRSISQETKSEEQRWVVLALWIKSHSLLTLRCVNPEKNKIADKNVSAVMLGLLGAVKFNTCLEIWTNSCALKWAVVMVMWATLTSKTSMLWWLEGILNNFSLSGWNLSASSSYRSPQDDI